MGRRSRRSPDEFPWTFVFAVAAIFLILALTACEDKVNIVQRNGIECYESELSILWVRLIKTSSCPPDARASRARVIP